MSIKNSAPRPKSAPVRPKSIPAIPPATPLAGPAKPAAGPPKPPASPPLAPTRQAKPTSVFSKIRLLVALAALVLILRLALSGWYLSSENDSPDQPRPPISPMTPKAAQAQAASLSPVALPANAITAGAASFLNSQVAALPALAQSAGAQNSRASNPGPQTPAIPLPPGDENLRRPQTVPAPPPRPTGPTSPLPPPPNAATPQAAEEQARRSFELNRRETELSAREQAIKELEADLNARLAAAEKSKAELKDLVSRNEAILEEQKAVQEQRKVEEEALKDARVEHLVLAFKGMKPEQAGQLVNSLDDAVAVSILSAMPGSQAGKILAMVQPEKAARLIKSISESRLDPKTILEQQTNAPGQGAPGATPNPAS